MNGIVAIIQARMGSTRLPGKVMLKVLDKELLYYQIERLKLCKCIAKIIIATSTSKKDYLIEQFCQKNLISYFRGSENNVLSRYYECALKFKVKTVIRITADCPLNDPYLLDRAIKHYLKHQQYDLLSTDPSYPEGYDFDIIPFKTLSIAWKEASLPSEREHVTSYIWNNPKFKTYRFSLKKDYSFLRLAVDEKIDFEVIKKILEEIYPKKGVNFTLEDILNLRKEKPLLFQKNIHIIRNEGYLKSVQED